MSENLVNNPTPEEAANTASGAATESAAEPAEQASVATQTPEAAAEENNPAPAFEEPAAQQPAPEAEAPAAPQEPVVEVNISEGGVTYEQDSQPPKKSNTPMIIVIVLLVVAVIAGAIALFTSGILGGRPSDPKEAVSKAFEETGKAEAAFQQKVTKEIPALAALAGPVQTKSNEHFSMTLKDLSGFDGASIISAMLKDTAIAFDVQSDMEKSILAMDMDVKLSGNDFLDAYLYMSPELFAGSIPELSEKILAINLQTFVEDYKKTPYYSGTYDDEMLEEIQAALNSYVDMVNSLTTASDEKMTEDMQTLLDAHLEAATYELGEEVDGIQDYIVTFQPDAMRKFSVDLLKYLYLDSELASIYEAMMTPSLSYSYVPNASYEKVIDEMLKEMDETFPDMDCVLVFSIDKKNIIRTVNVSIAPVVDESASADPYASDSAITMLMNYTLEGDNRAVDFKMDTEMYGEALTIMDMKISESLENGEYTLKLNMDMDMGYGDAATIPLTMTWNKDGTFKSDGQIKVDSYYSPIVLGYVIDGTANVDKNGTKYDLGGSQFYVSNGSEKYMVVLDLLYESTPLKDDIAAPEDTVDILKLSESELEALGNEMDAGLEKLGSTFEKFILGVA